MPQNNDEVNEQLEQGKKVLGAVRDRIPHQWGKFLSIGAGWVPLIEKLDVKLAEIDPNYKVLQVKEKFGGLRYYTRTSENLTEDQWKTFHALIDQAERDSFEICEGCGEKGTPAKKLNSGWIKTYCDDCRNENA